MAFIARAGSVDDGCWVIGRIGESNFKLAVTVPSVLEGTVTFCRFGCTCQWLCCR
jgi:hypothetical protein